MKLIKVIWEKLFEVQIFKNFVKFNLLVNFYKCVHLNHLRRQFNLFTKYFGKAEMFNCYVLFSCHCIYLKGKKLIEEEKVWWGQGSQMNKEITQARNSQCWDSQKTKYIYMHVCI